MPEAGGTGGQGVLQETGQPGGSKRPALDDKDRAKFISEGIARNRRSKYFRQHSEGVPRTHGRRDSGDGESVRVLGTNVNAVATYNPATGKIGSKESIYV